jgi:hypothetical protein
MKNAEVYKKALELVCESWLLTISITERKTIQEMTSYYLNKAQAEIEKIGGGEQ